MNTGVDIGPEFITLLVLTRRMKSFSAPVGLSKEIRLRYDQNVISLNFSAADLRISGCNNLFYKPVDYRPGLHRQNQETDFSGLGTTFTTILPV